MPSDTFDNVIRFDPSRRKNAPKEDDPVIAAERAEKHAKYEQFTAAVEAAAVEYGIEAYLILSMLIHPSPTDPTGNKVQPCYHGFSSNLLDRTLDDTEEILDGLAEKFDGIAQQALDAAADAENEKPE